MRAPDVPDAAAKQLSTAEAPPAVPETHWSAVSMALLHAQEAPHVFSCDAQRVSKQAHGVPATSMPLRVATSGVQPELLPLDNPPDPEPLPDMPLLDPAPLLDPPPPFDPTPPLDAEPDISPEELPPPCSALASSSADAPPSPGSARTRPPQPRAERMQTVKSELDGRTRTRPT